VRLNIDGGTAKQEVEGEHAPHEPAVGFACQDHQDGGHAHMRTGEGGRGTLARGLCRLYQTEEESVDGIGVGHQFGVVEEVVAHLGEMSGRGLHRGDGVEIELGSRDGQEYIYEVIDEEGAEDDETRAHKPFVTGKEVVEDDEEYHGIIGPIAHVEGFAPPYGVTRLAEAEGGLATE